MKYLFVIIICYLFFRFSVFSQINDTTNELENDTNILSLVFVGDIMGHTKQIQSAYNDSTKTYDYLPCFQYIKSIISSADIAFANLEVTLAGKPYNGYPQFSSPDALLFAIKDAGFDVLLNANNHACDRGKNGIVRTIYMMDSLRLFHAGMYVDSAQCDTTYPLIVEKNNIKLAILNYTYGTNGIPAPNPTIINRIDTIFIKKDIQKAKSYNPDKMIAIMHWGIEYKNVENTTQKKLFRFLQQQGVDIVIGSHPHVIQPMAWDKDSDNFVVYSMGNFISNQRDHPKDGGVIVKIQLRKTKNTTCIADAAYQFSWVYCNIDGKKQFHILPAAKYEQTQLFFQEDSLSYNKMLKFLDFERVNLNKHNKNVYEITE